MKLSEAPCDDDDDDEEEDHVLGEGGDTWKKFVDKFMGQKIFSVDVRNHRSDVKV